MFNVALGCIVVFGIMFVFLLPFVSNSDIILRYFLGCLVGLFISMIMLLVDDLSPKDVVLKSTRIVLSTEKDISTYDIRTMKSKYSFISSTDVDSILISKIPKWF